MAGQNKTETRANDARSVQAAGGEAGAHRSTIAFPYANLDDAVAIARAINTNVGNGTCTDSQLAAWVSLSHKSSGYRIRIYAARMFGLIEPAGTGLHTLTTLGRRAADSYQERAARAEAFLRVPLFRKVFEEHEGAQLPPAGALEREIEGLGVAPKQKERARQMLERCAQQAGYFEQGRGRLIAPGVRVGDEPLPPKKPKGGGGGDGGDGDDGEGEPRHLLLRGLIQRLPHGGETTWSVDKRISWLRTAVTIFDELFGDADEIEIRRRATKES